jgi:hypothetical protein
MNDAMAQEQQSDYVRNTMKYPSLFPHCAIQQSKILVGKRKYSREVLTSCQTCLGFNGSKSCRETSKYSQGKAIDPLITPES